MSGCQSEIPGFELGQTSFNSPPPPTSSDALPPTTSTRDLKDPSRRGSEGSEKMVRVERTNSFNLEKSKPLSDQSGGTSSSSEGMMMNIDGAAATTTEPLSEDEEPQDE